MENSKEIKKIQAFRACVEIESVKIDDVLWFRGNNMATILEYKHPSVIIHKNIDADFKKTRAELEGLLTVSNRDTTISSNEKKTMYINEHGLKQLLLKCQMPIATIIAREYGIEIQTKYLRKELEIIGFVQEYLTALCIPFQFQKRVYSYRVDLYLPDQAIAIEIDENGHSDRNVEYETKREKCICKALKCEFLRFNPDEEGFKMSHCIAQLTNMIFNHKSVSV